MSISKSAIILVKNLLIPLKNAGAISVNDFDEFMLATNQNDKPSPQKPPVLIKRQDAARLLEISTRSFDRLLREGRFHAIKIGKRSVRVNQAELYDFINSYTPNGGQL